MAVFAAILLLVVGLLASLAAATFTLACGANATPRQVSGLVRIVVAIIIICGAGMIFSLLALMHARTEIALMLAGLPLAGAIGAVIALWRIG